MTLGKYRINHINKKDNYNINTLIENVVQSITNPTLIIGQDNSQLPNNCITLNEYIALYPYLLGVYHKTQQARDMNELVKKVQQRIPNYIYDSANPSQIGAIMIMSLQPNWEIQVQVICDLLSSNNGIISKTFKQVNTHIPLYYYYGHKPIDQSILNMSHLKLSIETTYQLIYNQPLMNQHIIKADYEM